MGGDDAALGLLDNRHPDRADMGGGADVHERWGSGMTDWRAELIKDMINAMYKVENMQCSKLLVMTRAALAVAEPVIREQCAEIAEKSLSTWGAANALYIAAAIREGGKDG